MPYYTFKCNACEKIQDDYAQGFNIKIGDESEISCSCGGKIGTRVFQLYPVNFLGSSDLKANDHDYRFKDNLPKVLEERERAEKASSVGNNPYSHIDDISSGDSFGEVK